jgi:hypothetical protein
MKEAGQIMTEQLQKMGIKQPVMKYWNVLEREEQVRTSFDALEYIESHTGKLAPDLPLIPVTAYYIPDSNFFILEIPDDEETD